jgi:hypothetical protein
MALFSPFRESAKLYLRLFASFMSKASSHLRHVLSAFRFAVNSLQEFPELLRFRVDFLLGNGSRLRTQVIHNHSILFTVDDGVNPTSQRPAPVNPAATFLDLIENAVSSTVPQLSKTLPVETHKLLSFMSCSFQEPDIRSRQQHLGFLAANATV